MSKALAPFSARSTADEVLAGIDMSGKTAVVTGANIGIGFECAKALAKAGAHVVLAGRNASKNQQAMDLIKAQLSEASLEYQPLDLASLSSVKSCASALSDHSIDIIIANAGLMNTSYAETHDGLESTVGICHFGHYYLIRQLLPQLMQQDDPRVVMLSSSAHQYPKTLDFDNFPPAQKGYKTMAAYGQAKLCNMLFARELHRRYRDQGLTACSVHPGNLVTTNFGSGNPLTALVFKLVSPFTKNASQGASTAVLAASYPDTDTVAGEYLADCGIEQSSAEGRNDAVAERLWNETETRLSGLGFALV